MLLPGWKLLAVGSRDKAVQLWDVASLRKVRQLESAKLGYGAQNLVFSADGKLLAVPDNTAMHAKPPHGSKIDLFDVETGKLVQSLDTGGWGPGNVALSKNGKLLAAVGTSDTIKAWRLPQGEPLGDRFVGHDQSPEEIRFTPDGKTIVTGAPDGTVRVWDAKSGRQIEELKHDRPVSGLALSPDGRRILSSGLDDTVRLWDRESGKLLHKLKGHGFLGGRPGVRDRVYSRRKTDRVLRRRPDPANLQCRRRPRDLRTRHKSRPTRNAPRRPGPSSRRRISWATWRSGGPD